MKYEENPDYLKANWLLNWKPEREIFHEETVQGEWKPITKIIPHDPIAISKSQFSLNDEHIISSDVQGNLHIASTQTGKKTHFYSNIHAGEINDFTLFGHHSIATVGTDSKITLIDTRTQKHVSYKPEPYTKSQPLSSTFTCISTPPASNHYPWFVTGDYGGSTAMWDLRTPYLPIASTLSHTTPITCIDTAADGSLTASGGLDGAVRFYDNLQQDFPCVGTITSPSTGTPPPVTGVAFGPEILRSSIAVSSPIGGSCQLWDVRNRVRPVAHLRNDWSEGDWGGVRVPLYARPDALPRLREGCGKKGASRRKGEEKTRGVDIKGRSAVKVKRKGNFDFSLISEAVEVGGKGGMNGGKKVKSGDYGIAKASGVCWWRDLVVRCQDNGLVNMWRASTGAMLYEIDAAPSHEIASTVYMLPDGELHSNEMQFLSHVAMPYSSHVPLMVTSASSSRFNTILWLLDTNVDDDEDY